MNHPQANLTQILGIENKCINVDSTYCQKCNGYNYTCSHYQSQQTKPLGSKPLSLEDVNKLVDKTTDTHIIPSSYRDWINKGGNKEIKEYPKPKITYDYHIKYPQKPFSGGKDNGR